MGFSQAPGLPYSKLGIPEDGDTASRAISKGKYVIWKGKNYFAKTDILQGETFVEDTNLTEIPDGVLNGIVDALDASMLSYTVLVDGVYSNGNRSIPDITQYKWIGISVRYTDIDTLVNPTCVPVSMFIAGYAIQSRFMGSADRYAGCTYVNNTTIAVDVSGLNSEWVTIVFGIK